MSFHYVPSLNTGRQNNATLGVEKFADSRPADDKVATESISDIDDKVTSKILEDLRVSHMFSSIDFPASREKDDLIMKGEIKRFYWKETSNPVRYIPIIHLVLLFGIPIYHIDSVAELNVKIIDAKSGILLSEYDKTSTKEVSVNLYDRKTGEMGAELAEAFRDVMKQIKDGISNDIGAGKIKLSYKP